MPDGSKFGSNWHVSTRKREGNDGEAEDASRQLEHFTSSMYSWNLGLHSYLPYLRDRLVLARDLLTETGSIFVQIGDENVHLVRSLLDEVFGSECALVTIVVKKKGAQRSSLLDPVNDFILWYSKTSRHGTSSGPKYRPLFERWDVDASLLSEFKFAEFPDGRVHPVSAIPTENGTVIDYRISPRELLKDYPDVRLYRSNPLTSGGERKNQSLPFTFEDRTYSPGQGNSWKHTARAPEGELSGMERLALAGRLLGGEGQLRFKSYFDDFGHGPLSNWWDSLG